MSRPCGDCGLTDKVNSIGNSALCCSKKFKGNSQLSWRRKGDNY